MLGGSGEVIIVRCDEKEAMRSLEHSYKTTTTTYPEDMDAFDYIGGTTRKKLMMALENSLAKRTAVTLYPLNKDQVTRGGRDHKRRLTPSKPAITDVAGDHKGGEELGAPDFLVDYTQRSSNINRLPNNV